MDHQHSTLKKFSAAVPLRVEGSVGKPCGHELSPAVRQEPMSAIEIASRFIRGLNERRVGEKSSRQKHLVVVPSFETARRFTANRAVTTVHRGSSRTPVNRGLKFRELRIGVCRDSRHYTFDARIFADDIDTQSSSLDSN
jgi:hypothetical protein